MLVTVIVMVATGILIVSVVIFQVIHLPAVIAAQLAVINKQFAAK